MKPNELVKAAMEATESKTGAALGDLVGIDRRRMSDYMNDYRWPDNNAARILAEAAGLNPLEVIAELEIARASDEATRSAWGKALASMRGSATVLLLAVTAGLSALVTAALQQPFGLAEVLPKAMEILLSIMFIMSTSICAWASLQSSDS